MLKIRIWYEKDNVPDALLIKCIKGNKVVGYEPDIQTRKDVIVFCRKFGVSECLSIFGHRFKIRSQFRFRRPLP